MQRPTFVLALALAGAISVGAIGGFHAHHEKKATTEQKTKFSVFVKTELAGMEGKEVTMVHIEQPPG